MNRVACFLPFGRSRLLRSGNVPSIVIRAWGGHQPNATAPTSNGGNCSAAMQWIASLNPAIKTTKLKINMQKPFMTALLLYSAVAASGQGTVYFSNNALSRVKMVDLGQLTTNNVPTSPGGLINYGLFYGVGQSNTLTLLADTIGVNSTSSAGIIASPSDGTSLLTAVRIPGTTEGETDVWVQVEEAGMLRSAPTGVRRRATALGSVRLTSAMFQLWDRQMALVRLFGRPPREQTHRSSIRWRCTRRGRPDHRSTAKPSCLLRSDRNVQRGGRWEPATELPVVLGKELFKPDCWRDK